MAIVTVSTSNTFNEWRVATNQLVTEVNKTESGTAVLSVDTLTANTITANGDIAVNGGDLTTTQTTANVFNTTATTLNLGGAATIVEIGAASGTTNINNTLDVDGDVNIDGGDLTVSTASFNLANTNATTLNVGGAATALNLGAATGTTTIRNDASVSGNTSITGTLGVTGNVTLSGELRGPSTFTIDPAVVGDDTGTVVIKGNLQVDGTTTTINSTTLTVDDLNIVLASGAANAAAANGAGITIDGANATITYLSSGDKFSINKAVDLSSTLTISGDVTLSGGTANGVAYLNGSKALTTGSALTFDGFGSLALSNGNSGGTNEFSVTNTNTTGYAALAIKNTGASGKTYEAGVGGNGTAGNYQNNFYIRDVTGNATFALNLNNIIFIPGGTTEVARFTSTGLKSSIAGTNADPVFSYTSDTNTGIFFPAADKLGFTAGGGADQMVLTSTGLGIGTNNPLNLFQIGTSGAIDGNSLQFYFRNNVYYDPIDARDESIKAGYSNVIVLDNHSGGIIFQTTSTSAAGANVALSLVERARITALGGFETKPAANGHAIFNEDGVDADFRVESDANTHRLFVDAGADVVFMGTTTNTNSSKLVVDGTISETVSSIQYLVASQADIGTGANEIPLNAYLGGMAYQGTEAVSIAGSGTTRGYLYLGSTQATSSGVFGSLNGMNGDNTGTIIQMISDGTENSGYFKFFTTNTSGTTAERFRIDNAEVIVNDTSNDIDFRVESDNRPHMFFVDAGTDQVSIGTSSARTNSTLTVSYWGNSASNNAQISINANDNSGTGQSVLEILAGSGSTNRASRINFLNGVASTTTPRWTLISDYDQNGTNDLRLVNASAQNLMTFKQTGEVVFNEDSVDYDFRVESDTNTHAFFVDAGNSRIGVNNSSPVAVLDVTSPSDGSPVLGTTKTRVYEFSGTILENSNHQIFKVTIGDIRINALLRIRLMSTNTAGIGRPHGSTMDVVVGKIDGNAFFYVKNQDSGNISLSLPVASGNDVIFGATNTNNGTGQNIGYACVVELVSNDALSSFTFTDIAPGTTHTGDNSLNTYRKYVVDTSILEATTSNVVFNEGGADVDFRVESDNSTHMLFVDAGEDVVKIGSTTAKGTGNRLIVGPGNTNANTVLIINTEDQNYNGLSISNWDGAATTYGPRIAFDNSGYGGFTIGMGDARNSFDLCSTWGTPLLRLTPSAAIFNEDGADVDFRVESDGSTHMLFVDGGNNRINIGGSSTTETTLMVHGGTGTGYAETFRVRAGGDANDTGVACFFGQAAEGNSRGLYLKAGRESSDRALVQFYLNNSGGVVGSNIYEMMRFYAADGGVTGLTTVFNELSNDIDFRVESDTNTHAFFVDAGNSRIGFFDSAPDTAWSLSTSTSSATGDMKFNGVKKAAIRGNKPASTAVTVRCWFTVYTSAMITFMYAHTNGGDGFSFAQIAVGNAYGTMYNQTIASKLTNDFASPITFTANTPTGAGGSNYVYFTMPAGNASDGFYSITVEGTAGGAGDGFYFETV